MIGQRILGVVIRKPVRKSGDLLLGGDGKVATFPFVRTYKESEGEDVPMDFFLFRPELRTPGLARLEIGQMVTFEPEGRVARDFRRVPVWESRQWQRIAEDIRELNGQSGYTQAYVTFYNDEDGWGFAELVTNQSKIFFHINRVVFRDEKDIVTFTPGQPIYVKLGRTTMKEGKSPAAEEVICLEEEPMRDELSYARKPAKKTSPTEPTNWRPNGVGGVMKMPGVPRPEKSM